jgi:recombination protein RecA
MPSLARRDLESLLRARQLDRTLTSELPPVVRDELTIAATGIARLDVQLAGGFPRGQLSEIVGARSTGRTSLLLRLLAAATDRGELVAVVDTLDTLDVHSAQVAGIRLDRLLWVRGHAVTNPGLCRDTNLRALEQGLKALTLVLQAGNFGVVAMDLAEVPRDAVARLPFTTWLRLQRIIENSQTACVLLASEPVARSAAGLTLRVGTTGSVRAGVGVETGTRPGATATATGAVAAGGEASDPASPRRGIRFRRRLFQGLEVTAAVVRARVSLREEAGAAFSTLVHQD